MGWNEVVCRLIIGFLCLRLSKKKKKKDDGSGAETGEEMGENVLDWLRRKEIKKGLEF